MASGTIQTNYLVRCSIANSTNFNDYSTPSAADMHYFGSNISSMTNRPSGENGNVPFALDVLNMGGYRIQILRVYTATGAPREWRRQQYYQDANTRPYGNWVNDSAVAINDATSNSFEANTWKYTGLSFTIPANCIFGVTATASYNASSPKYISIGGSSTAANSTACCGANAGICATATLSDITGSSSKTLYIWAQYSGAGTNNCSYVGWYKPR